MFKGKNISDGKISEYGHKCSLFIMKGIYNNSYAQFFFLVFVVIFLQKSIQMSCIIDSPLSISLSLLIFCDYITCTALKEMYTSLALPLNSS